MQCSLSLTRDDNGHSSPDPQFLVALLLSGMFALLLTRNYMFRI
jgi:hypothetical protein